MTITRAIVNAAPQPGGAYSHAVSTPDLVHLAGQVGIDPATNLVSDDIYEQTRQALANLATVLNNVNSNLGRVVKTTCYLADLSEFAAFDQSYREVFGDQLPARTTVGVALATPYRVEIDAVALLR